MGAYAHLAFAIAAGLCVLALPQPSHVRAAAVSAMIPVALADPPTWSFAAAGGLLALAVARPAAAAQPAPLERIQRRLEWCRRREETGHLLWVHAPQTDRETAVAALDAFRVTDAAALLHGGDGREEIVAMVDNANFEPHGLERRLRRHVGDAAGFGWAAFPDDGVTLDALFRHARAAAVTSTSAASSSTATQLQAPFRRLGGRPPAGVPARSSNQG